MIKNTQKSFPLLVNSKKGFLQVAINLLHHFRVFHGISYSIFNYIIINKKLLQTFQT